MSRLFFVCRKVR
ncbi:Putative PyrE leader peptide [Escherichia coli]|uniref:Putative PyrE leader peptide n=2 Tax=Escherichia coli TaxID=562 RepID=YZPY_ECOLX|nr:PUTATIVE PSEUDOGENE: RecName: Full=Putative PyrE leader peptide [Escherichia coli]CAI6152822.1 Putative PyrE leader peptide [Escherichia coli]CAI6152891.1 Putative PyrE leader peptide [Escherichia coli]CAI6154831.1 Putative PyrE leader peptide [Escherichia coli]CAI6155108.1 Putative PyrE leader peptide [Escherichia coli]CAI6156351.1 Putative PyrE leader peptide [Escherichia coli]